MSKLQIFLAKRDAWEAIVKSDLFDDRAKIKALTELYFLHQGDVHNQAKYVRQIQDLVAP